MAECMAFPKTADEFIGQYKFTDTKQEYTNGAELIPVFRVKQMMEHYFAKDNNVPSKWIPVTERLPDNNERVLVYHDDGMIRFGINKGGFADVVSTLYLKHNHRTCFSKVTHWMPLPEAPKGE